MNKVMQVIGRAQQALESAAFAEENEHDTARELLTERRETERVANRPTTRPQPRQTLRAD